MIFKSYLVAVRASTNISPQSCHNKRHLSLNDIDISGKHVPFVFDFKHEEAAIEVRKITLDEFFKT